MNENQFWSRIWLYATVVVVVLLCCVTGCQVHQDSLFVEGGYCTSPLRGGDHPWIKCDAGFTFGPVK